MQFLLDSLEEAGLLRLQFCIVSFFCFDGFLIMASQWRFVNEYLYTGYYHWFGVEFGVLVLIVIRTLYFHL